MKPLEDRSLPEKTWEQIAFESNGRSYATTDRISVPGGWIYREIVSFERTSSSVSTVFVPFARFPGHELEGRFATSPREPEKAEDRLQSAIPDFSAPAPKRGGGS